MKISNNQKILAVVAIVGVAAFLYQRKKDKTIAAGGAKPAVMPDSSSASFAPREDGGRWVVGAYDTANNETYVYPEGNRGGGKRIKGRLNVQIGTTFRPNW